MAAKSKKRLSKIENKLLKLEKLNLSDVICSICQSILIEPVTLPCHHDFCQSCFNESIENNALCCPLCRLRIGSWLRTATKQKNLVNNQLWNFIKNKFPKEIDKKFKGEDVDVPSETPLPRLSAPGEIRSEYEAELKRLRAERLRLEQKQYQETELLIKRLQQEEQETHKKYLDSLKQDELLARQLQEESAKSSTEVSKRKTVKSSFSKAKLKPTTIDSYLSKSVAQATIIKNSPLLTDDNTSTDASTPITPSNKTINRVSPEILPSYGRLWKNFLDKKLKTGTSVWNKENGEKLKKKEGEQEMADKTVGSDEKTTVKTKNGVQSVLVSLPLPHTGLLHHKTSLPDRNIETGSVDSMRQELCYFKPIEGTTPTSFNTNKSLPLKVPGLRVEKEKVSSKNGITPTRAQYIDGLCQLRNLSLAQKLPSAFVVALNILRSKKEISKKISINTRSRVKKNAPSNLCVSNTLNSKRATINRNKQAELVDGIVKLNSEVSLRRTRSMGSISKDENEVTPKKKVKERKFYSDRKPYLRSDSKRMHTKTPSCSPPSFAESTNNNKVSLAVKNLSSPLANCDVKNILREQLRIEKIIEQEKSDFELARKMEAEWNGRRLRRAPAKRQLTLNYALRPTKKLKV
ncbi:E3 ubiquitin-protein ligase RNF168-like isoform X1 [Maniola jurtina]|uniref:E3 ubiquitin-protein ligase RNF168-like isoform X1 n=1 Tax=Maniola jurtina TaxID=191418 RepID=UPI001E68AE7E|nr:E3 ubiquitin-protein ligase RNF168-like isoform X1 [Maniola jurtina]